MDAEFCSELGKDSSTWSKNAPLEKPTWIQDSFELLFEAFNQAFDGEIDIARSILENSRDLDMRYWYHDHAQHIATWRVDELKIEAPKPILPLDPLKTFSKVEPQLFARDFYKCRYCSVSVIPKKVFKKAQSLIGTKHLPIGRTNLTRSGFYLMFVRTFDHVLPWSLGGGTDESNLVTSCWSCNYGKSNFTVEQLGIRNPFLTDAEHDPENRVEQLLTKGFRM